jgi:hypothetical protein
MSAVLPTSPCATPFHYPRGKPSSANVTDSSGATVVMPYNANRNSAIFCNKGSSDIYLGIGYTAVAGQGPLLKAGGGAYEINSTNLTPAEITAICGSGETSGLSMHEG